MECDSHQTRVPPCGDLDLRVKLWTVFALRYPLDPAGPLSHQGVAVQEKNKRPGDLKVCNPGLHGDPFHLWKEYILHILRDLSPDRLAQTGTGKDKDHPYQSENRHL